MPCVFIGHILIINGVPCKNKMEITTKDKCLDALYFLKKHNIIDDEREEEIETTIMNLED